MFSITFWFGLKADFYIIVSDARPVSVWQNVLSSYRDNHMEPGGGGTPIYGYMGKFQAIWSGMGSSNHRKLVYYWAPFNGIAHKRWKSRTIEYC